MSFQNTKVFRLHQDVPLHKVQFQRQGQCHQQVWPLIKIFHFCKKKSLTCLEGKLMTPLRRNAFLFRSYLNSLVSVSDP